MPNKLTIEQLNEILERFENGLLSTDEVKNLVFIDKDIKPYRTKEWQDIRNSKIKNYCEKCSSVEAPFVLQHVWHNIGQSGHRACIINEKINNYISDNYLTVTDDVIEKYIEVNGTVQKVCPKCNSRNIVQRKTLLPKFICNRCKFTFDIPTQKKVLKKLFSRDELVKKILRYKFWSIPHNLQ